LAKEQKKRVSSSSSSSSPDGGGGGGDAQISILNEKEASATSFLSFLQQARTGQAIPPEVIIKFAKYFEDNLTLDNMGRMQLINMCKYMGIPPYGNDNLLRFQLRHRIRLLKDDDQRILWEGIDSLTKLELREACRERGMRSTGLSKAAYRSALQQWLELSVQKDVPISLLIMSRTFFLHDEMLVGSEEGGLGISGAGGSGGAGAAGAMVGSSTKNDGVTGLADAMSGIDKEVLNEIVLEMASSEEKSSNADVIKIQLEVLEHQNELIKEEQEERDAAIVAKKLKEEKEKSIAAASISGGDKDISRADGGSSSERILLKEMDTTIITGIGTTTSVDAVGTTLASGVGASIILPNESIALNSSSSGGGGVVEDDVQTELSTEEIDAISQLTSPDPVLREREELKRIKCSLSSSPTTTAREATLVSDEAAGGEDKATKDILMQSVPTAGAASSIEPAVHEGVLDTTTAPHEKEVVLVVGDKKLQKAIDRLKSRVESMVGKIESRLSDIEVKIGNKFHLLDKDGDGVLTMEEMAQVLQTVLKRELTAEEAMAIASDMDQNKDGVFSIAELAQWAETNTIVKLAEDGREKDLDDMITERVANLNEKNKLQQQQRQKKPTEESSSSIE
jgi:LETM1 and EF-hand domain-containing protein 1